MALQDEEALNARLRAIEAELSSALAAIKDVENKFARIDDAIVSFSVGSQQFVDAVTQLWVTSKKAWTS